MLLKASENGRFIEIPECGTTFVHDVAGPVNAPVLVLLHGWTWSADLNWSSSLPSLTRHFRVITLDLRGHGRWAGRGSRFRLETCADDVAALLRHLNVPRCIAVGYSMGGAVAQLLWRRHPDLVDGLVLCATATTFLGSGPERLALGVLPPAAVGARAWSPFRRWLSAVRSTTPARLGSPRWAFDHAAGFDWSQIIDAGRALGRFDGRRSVGQITVPTAVVATMEDHIVPACRQLELAASIPGATLHRVAGGHAACLVTAKRFSATLTDACRSVAIRVAHRQRPVTLSA